MLTRQDRTIADCLAVMDLIAPARLRHVGFKDVGVAPEILHKLADKIRAAGAITYMEVVSTTPEACLNSTRMAVELGIDRLLGGTDVEAVQGVIKGTKMEYYPFCGFPTGHPTKLGGRPDQVEAHCRRFIERGCAGTDLLAYRATAADPLDLVKAARRGLGSGKPLIVAGSVSTAKQIGDLKRAGADAFTIGSAAFDGSYAPNMGHLVSQLAAIQADCGKA
jgi:hypothetical protein